MTPTQPPTLPGLSHQFSHRDFDYRMVKAFGPTILETKLPAEILDNMLSLTDALLADEERISYGPSLVGQIREEPLISEARLQEYQVFEYIRSTFAEYVLGCSYCDADETYKQSVQKFQSEARYHNPVNVNVEAAWLVSQQTGEYNPIHCHSLSTLSSVMYLKVPDTLQSETIPGKAQLDGYIEWVHQSTSELQNATVRVRPQAGMFYIFPAHLLHLVYPFRSTQERRSVSINASHKL